MRDWHLRRRVGKSAHEILRTLIDREARFYPPYEPEDFTLSEDRNVLSRNRTVQDQVCGGPSAVSDRAGSHRHHVDPGGSLRSGAARGHQFHDRVAADT